MNNLAIGTWVKFKVDKFIDSERIILKGMLGEIIESPVPDHLLPSALNQPWVSILGSTMIISFEQDWLEMLEKNPSDIEREHASTLHQNPLMHYEEKHGYTGFVQFKSDLLPQEELLDEIKNLLEGIIGWIAEENRNSHVKGNLKRLTRMLESFSRHPQGKQAQHLAQTIRKKDLSSAQILDVFSNISDWVNIASKFERIETITERRTKEAENSTKRRLP
ncbi:MAG: hypothetical protein WD053_05485 [Gracilimonas sp.]